MNVRTRRRPVWRNFAASLSSELAGQAIAFVLGIYLARTLGPHGFGTWVFAASILTYAVVIVDGGTDLWGTREVSGHPQRLRHAVMRVTMLRWLQFVPTVAVLGLVAAFLDAERRLTLLLGITSLVALAMNSTFAHRGLELLTPAFATLVQRLLMLGLVLLFVQTPGDAPQVTLWQGASEIAAAVLLFVLLKPRFGTTSGPTPPLQLRRLLREAWPMGASRALRALPTACAPVVLGLTWSDAEVGNYGVAMRIGVLLLVLAGVFSNATFPAVARACIVGGEPEARAVTATLRLLATVLCPFAVAGAVLAEPLIRLLFSSRFAAAAAPLAILLLASFVMALTDLVRRVLVARHRQGLDLRMVLLTTIGCLLSIALLTPWLGLVATAAAMLAGELLLLILCQRALTGMGLRINLVRAIARPALASMAMGMLILPLRHASLWIAVAVGAVAYLGFAGAMRAQIRQDIRQLERARAVLDEPAPGETP